MITQWIEGHPLGILVELLALHPRRTELRWEHQGSFEVELLEAACN